ncbi:hypothetical protein C2S51_001301 [Perilla frutescens var. frutescens]|nr:hypothetical protein C2S51_001301 [Perilla frutescens var. frutescens]
MAGLQYNFFPTDFFFPPAQITAADSSNHPQPSVVKLPKSGETDNARASSTVIGKSLKTTTTSSSTSTLIQRSKES